MAEVRKDRKAELFALQTKIILGRENSKTIMIARNQALIKHKE
jgi:hypothetical protein